MQYKTFLIKAFQPEDGKWRARITRAHGRPLTSADPKRRELITSVDCSSAVEALTMAMETIDAPSFSGCTEPSTEKYWRLLTKADRKLAAVTSGSIEGISEQ
jgi:hypothetical protein